MASTSKVDLSGEDDDEQLERFDDFTLASSWERFISDIEAVCRQWLADGPNNLLASFYQFTSYKIPGMNDMGNRIHYGFC
ncbi:hypothetical protein NC652_023334 [Populus alba x Populus x berolinensis]|uniref:Rab3 GTPase-activating protein catalytic subunit n=1 Tax=Populus alba x Populus x berolinensis TaxID=444605 RepID=A0AAD6MGE8_9ROSI|nr:hypothetical protein NC651_022171 [Populus alba x Populus x berolinensis]KAJ6905538.1 hypothetical protein NC652_023334 [Populus alba x Populus x berolinensis]KAJ6985038.1 hypothetical protein NC653_023123 [Populus alba x Populus x berolinensis]